MPISEKQKKLLILLANGDFRSGTDLAEALGLSRSAVWKHLNGLTELGLHYVGVSGRGYRLNKPLEFLQDDKITAQLDEAVSSQIVLEIHDQLDSTNSYLLKKSQQDEGELNIACFAEHQTAGKGRRGRSWISPYGSNIYLSLLWRFPQSGLGEISGLSLAVGVAAIRALAQLQMEGIYLKWPNDLYWQDKKLGGILIEVSGEACGPCTAVIGLGLNVYVPSEEAEKIDQAWTDLSRIRRFKKVSRNVLAAALLNQLVSVVADFEKKGLAAYLDEWRSYDGLRGKHVCLYIGSQTIEGIVHGIDENGLLLLQHTDGIIHAYASGEVSFHRMTA